MSEFSFRLIDLPDGNQVIDPKKSTRSDNLTMFELAEYQYIENLIGSIEWQKKMEDKEQKEAERQRKIARNPFLRLACLCGLF